MTAPEFTETEMIQELLSESVACDMRAVGTTISKSTEVWQRQSRAMKAIAARLTATSAGWQPPPEAERADGFRCLGWVSGDLLTVEWVKVFDPEAPIRGWWVETRERCGVNVAAFAPLPPPPKETTDG
jgi:hypothetical protein